MLGAHIAVCRPAAGLSSRAPDHWLGIPLTPLETTRRFSLVACKRLAGPPAARVAGSRLKPCSLAALAHPTQTQRCRAEGRDTTHAAHAEPANGVHLRLRIGGALAHGWGEGPGLYFAFLSLTKEGVQRAATNAEVSAEMQLVVLLERLQNLCLSLSSRICYQRFGVAVPRRRYVDRPSGGGTCQARSAVTPRVAGRDQTGSTPSLAAFSIWVICQIRLTATGPRS